MDPREIGERGERLSQLLIEVITTHVPEPTTQAELAVAITGLANVLGVLLATMPEGPHREEHLIGFIQATIAAFRVSLDAKDEREG